MSKNENSKILLIKINYFFMVTYKNTKNTIESIMVTIMFFVNGQKYCLFLGIFGHLFGHLFGVSKCVNNANIGSIHYKPKIC
jgi:hypothetical protein